MLVSRNVFFSKLGMKTVSCFNNMHTISLKHTSIITRGKLFFSLVQRLPKTFTPLELFQFCHNRNLQCICSNSMRKIKFEVLDFLAVC